MKKFKFSMEKILELRRFEQSQAEAELGKVNAQIAQIQQKLEAIAVKKISSTKEFNTDSNIMVMNQLQNYFYMLDQKKEECLEEMAKLELVAEEKREVVRKCMQNVKVLEKLKENKLKEWHKEFQKQEENVMDDVVTAQSYRE
ncbi:MAG: flagellar export protein FliJ [Treponema sp.]|nr:flagellar export protein FliJ [Treponema sp.]